MDQMNLAKENITAAFERLAEAINHVKKIEDIGPEKASIIMENEKLRASLRDSLIQRFEFCVDLFWKYLDKYLKNECQIITDFTAPKPVIKAACKAKIITELDAEKLLEMIDGRNKTLHIYKEELADLLSSKIPGYYKIMQKYLDQLTSKQQGHRP